jgi:hypothetical protein
MSRCRRRVIMPPMTMYSLLSCGSFLAAAEYSARPDRTAGRNRAVAARFHGILLQLLRVLPGRIAACVPISRPSNESSASVATPS